MMCNNCKTTGLAYISSPLLYIPCCITIENRKLITKKRKNKKEGEKMKKERFHGLKKFIKTQYWLDEVHSRDEIVGKWCIALEVPGANHDPIVFTMSVRGYDTNETSAPENNNDEKCIKRPAIFETSDECKRFASEMFFPQTTLKLIRIGDFVFNHQVFAKNGAYIVHKPIVEIPT